jgi:hypothetical protein
MGSSSTPKVNIKSAATDVLARNVGGRGGAAFAKNAILGSNEKKYNTAGAQPIAPTFKSALNNAGNLQKGYKLANHTAKTPDQIRMESILGDVQARYGAINADPRGMEAMRAEALRTGPSAWADLQNQNQLLEEQDARDLNASQGMGAEAQARSALASKGGLSQGGAQSLAKAGMQNNMLGNQQIARAGMSNRLGIATTDEENRQRLLAGLPAAEVAWLQPELQKADAITGVQSDEQQRDLALQGQNISNLQANREFNADMASDRDRFNIGTKLGSGGIGGINAANQNAYDQQMAAWAGAKQSDAIKSSAGRGGVFGNMFSGLGGNK